MVNTSQGKHKERRVKETRVETSTGPGALWAELRLRAAHTEPRQYSEVSFVEVKTIMAIFGADQTKKHKLSGSFLSFFTTNYIIVS